MRRTFAVLVTLSFISAFSIGGSAQRRRAKARSKARTAAPSPQRDVVSGTPKVADAESVQVVGGNTHTVTVNPNGTFTPENVNIKRGDTVKWINLTRTDAIVQIANPASSPSADVCGINDNRT